MTILGLASVGSGAFGIAALRALTTMSIGFSNSVAFESTFRTTCSSFLISTGAGLFGVGSDGGSLIFDCTGVNSCSFNLDSVISLKGVACLDCSSGDFEGCGVGMGGSISVFSSGVMETRDFRLARTFFTLRRLGGDAFLEGEGDSTGALLSSGLKTWDGSTDDTTDSLTRVRRPFVVRGVAGVSVVVFRLELRLVRAGAGVNSSSLSSAV
jgi:hypothetical protein